MSSWIKPLNLKGNIMIDTGENISQSSIVPSWAEFLLWLGWWMHQNSSPEHQIVAAVLLPTRICASAFCSLGSILSAVSTANGDTSDLFLSPDEIMHIEPGTSVFIHKSDDEYFFGKEITESIYSGVETSEIPGFGKQDFARFDLLIRKKADTRRSRLVPLERLKNFHISFEMELTRRALGRLEKNYNFYRSLVRECNQKWFLEGEPGSLILANRAWWKRQTRDMIGATGDDTGVSNILTLSEVLMVTEDQADSTRRTLLKSPKATLDGFRRDSLTVLDGHDALDRLAEINSSRVVVLLEHTELDESARRILDNVSRKSRGNELPSRGIVPDNFPSGIAMAVYQLPYPVGVNR